LPLYEARLIRQFDHRFATYEDFLSPPTGPMPARVPAPRPHVFSDPLALTPTLSLTLSGHYNHTRVALSDLFGANPALQGDHKSDGQSGWAAALMNLSRIFIERPVATAVSTAGLCLRESIHDVNFTLVLAIALVVGVILAFLRNLSSTLITALILPTSVLGTFTVMYLLGYSLNNLSLMALTLAVGFVVDDAIVVLENKPPHGDGQGPLDRHPRRYARDRLHHRFDDGVAGRGVYPDPVHGRDPRTAVQGIRGHRGGRGAGLGGRLFEPHAPAVQPVFAVHKKARPGLPAAGKPV
jgi:AcrB/AcrD/AcrF family